MTTAIIERTRFDTVDARRVTASIDPALASAPDLDASKRFA